MNNPPPILKQGQKVKIMKNEIMISTFYVLTFATIGLVIALIIGLISENVCEDNEDLIKDDVCVNTDGVFSESTKSNAYQTGDIKNLVLGTVLISGLGIGTLSFYLDSFNIRGRL